MQASFVYVFPSRICQPRIPQCAVFLLYFQRDHDGGKDWEFEASRPAVPPASAEAVTEKP